jgi:bisphosphoglycerate-independent phosphoglycerate mutase (AlkP superfamily)
MEREIKRQDRETFQYAFEYLKRERPRVLFLGFDGTDDHGHGGRYDEYLKSAHAIDAMLRELWIWVQTQPDFKDQTTLLITTDHGRGIGKNSWRNHRLLAKGSRHIWFAVIGPDTPAFGELKYKEKYYQKQVAGTIAAFFGRKYTSKKVTGEIVQTMIDVPGSLLGNEVILGRSKN